MENILKNPEVQMRGVVQIDESLQAYRRQVEKEIESRTKRGDPVIYATANKKLKADFRVVREAEIMDDLLKDVSPPPVPLPVALPVEPHNKPEEQPAIPPAIVTDAAKIEPARNAPRPAVELTDHEEKVWEVIQRGSKGRTYCRELDNANIQPRRDGVWKDGPHKYVAAYDLGQPWRHRIEDEKSKIRRKAKAAKPAGALASE